MNNYIQKIVEDFDFNNIRDDNDKAGSFAENVLGVVDLGLPSGTLWCKCNLGAKTETEYGDYYAWGELTTKSEFTDENYTCSCTNKQLPPEYDVATQTLGNHYSIPTKNQCEELIKYTDNKWIKNYKGTGVNGIIFRKNDNSIFIPAAGYRDDSILYDDGSECCVWSSNLSTNYNNYNCAWYLGFVDTTNMYYNYRLCGLSVRPVFKK